MPWKLQRSGDSVEKIAFADASERGRYAAEQRWKGHVKSDVARSIMDRVKDFGGLSVKILSGDEPTTGFMVAVRGLNMEVSEEEFFDAKKGKAALAEFLKRNREALGGGMYLGLWWDKANKEVVFDVTENIQSRDEAVAAGKERNQQAIWDVENGEEISTGGSGDRGAEGAVGKAAEADFGDDGSGDRGVRRQVVGGREPRTEGLNSEVLVAVSEDGDRLFQWGATADLNALGFESELSGRFSFQPIPYGRIEFADGGWQRVNSLYSVLRTGFWSQVAEISLVEDASVPFEKGRFASRSEAARYAAQQRWKGHVKAEEPQEEPVGIPPSVQLTPTWDAEEAKRTGRPFAPLLPENIEPQVKEEMLAVMAEIQRFIKAREVFRPFREEEVKEFQRWKKEAVAREEAFRKANPEADWKDVFDHIKRTIGYRTPPYENSFTFDRFFKDGKVSPEAVNEYHNAASAWFLAGQRFQSAVEVAVFKAFGYERRIDPDEPWKKAIYDLKTGEEIEWNDSYPYGLHRTISDTAKQAAEALYFRFRDVPDLIRIDSDGNIIKDIVQVYTGYKPIENTPQHLERQQRIIDDPKTRVVVFVPPRRLTSVIKAGRLKTQHETDTSGGYKDEGSMHRKQWEGWALGMHPQMDDTKRPIFGVLAVGGVREPYAYGAEQYGRVGIVLKRDVHSRSTFTDGDSLNGFGGTPLAGKQEKLSIVTADDQIVGGRLEGGGGTSYPRYHEAQVFGGVSVADIDYVTVPRGVVSKAGVANARKAGIRVVEYDSENIHSGEKEFYGKGGEIRRPETTDGLWGVLPEPSEKMASRVAIIDALLKGRFASRSEAARYAAQQRWKGHVKEESSTRVDRLKEMLAPSTIARWMQQGEEFGRRGFSNLRVGMDEYLADTRGPRLVDVMEVPSMGQWNEKTGTFMPANGELLRVQLPNRAAMEVDDAVNAVGMLAHEIIMERLPDAIAAAEKVKVEAEAAAVAAQNERKERLNVFVDGFRARPDNMTAKGGKWRLMGSSDLRTIDPDSLCPTPDGGGSKKYQAAQKAGREALRAAQEAYKKESEVDERVKARNTELGIDVSNSVWGINRALQQKDLGKNTELARLVTEADRALVEEAKTALQVRYAAFEAATSALVKAAKLYDSEQFEKPFHVVGKEAAAAVTAQVSSLGAHGRVYGREFVKLMKEVGVPMYEGQGPQPIFGRGLKGGSKFMEDMKLLPEAYATQTFSRFKVTVDKQQSGGSWAEISWKTGGSRIVTDDSTSTNVHEVTHAAADAIPFVSMIQRTMNARRAMGVRVEPTREVRRPPLPEDGPEAAARVKRERVPFVRRPLTEVAAEGVERYYQGRYSMGNRFVRDQFADTYAGRLYDDDARETLTRGMEYLFTGDHGRAPDAGPLDVDHVASTMGMLLVVGLSQGAKA